VLRFIVNPRSGRAATVLPAIRAYASQRGASIAFTERGGHARALAQTALAEGCDPIVAVGGDGTMNEVASVLAGSPATMGLVPCGSGDGLGRHLRIHGSVGRALQIIDAGQTRLIDSGLADGHPFFAVAGLGFEADIAHRFNQLERRGFLRYLRTSAVAWRQWPPQTYRIHEGNTTDEITAFTLAVANTAQYGNNAVIAPTAKIDDGQLDLCAVRPLTAFNVIPMLVGLFAGRANEARVLRRRATRFVVQRSSPGLLHTDGETHDAGTSIEFVVRPASLRILAPHQV
jgi:diacylglycerol kinase (ATP)